MLVEQQDNHLEEQSLDIANRYGLIPITVTQDNMSQYLLLNSDRNYVSDITNVLASLKDSGDSRKSTMSICSYMNCYTPNKRLALFHSTGTGKTRKSLLAAMQYDRDITIVAVHSIQVTSFTSELNGDTVINNLHPGFKKRLDIMTCKSISTAVGRNDLDRLDFYFKDRVIIIDEMHHIRNRDSKTSTKMPLFNSVIDVLTRYKNSIVLFLTATPLVDTASEIFGVFKLLKGYDPPQANPRHIAMFLDGYVSEYTMDNLPSKDVEVKCIMREDGEQCRLYRKHQHDRTSVHSKTGAISRFITQDDESASECSMSIQTIIDVMLNGIQFESISQYHEACIDCLQYISIKMYLLVKFLQEHRDHPKFIFDSWKKRGGIDRLAEVLSLPAVGYHMVMSKEDALDKTKGPKMLVLHKLSQYSGGTTLINELREIYNSEANRSGELIELILATPKYAENMSITTAKSCHRLSTLWNVTGIIQVIGRINRRTSLWFLNEEDRIIHNYDYILYQPDGSETVESKIKQDAVEKYEEILPVLHILTTGRIERYYTDISLINYLRDLVYPINCRINYRMRLCSEAINYRNILIDIGPFLSKLENSVSLYDLMFAISREEVGYTKLFNIAIQTMEYLYIRKAKGHKLSTKQSAALMDVDKAFIDFDGHHTHILYFANNDTVEYQRLAKVEKRTVRVLDADNWIWVDVKNVDVVESVTNKYIASIDDFTTSIEQDWNVYGYYGVKYILSSSCKLVKYKSTNDVNKSSFLHSVDRRKVSRGEKWQYYNKRILIGLLNRLHKYSEAELIYIVTHWHTDTIFDKILEELVKKNMLLILPI